MLVAAVCLLVGCSADGIHSPQKFFPGSRRTSWTECSKSGLPGNEIAVCAQLGLLPGASSPSYNIQFVLPAAAHVRISVYDEHAALLKVIYDADEPATLPGQFRPATWDLTDAAGERVPAGDYRLYFQAGEFVSTSDVALE